MSNYYRHQSHFYDATQWMFLYGRNSVVEQTDIRPGDRVLEIGCGNGSNFQAIQRRLRGSGEVLGVDCARPMLDKAARRTHENRWKNVRLIDVEYGKEVITRGRTNVVLFSYSLSMISDWKLALACAHAELWPGGRIGVVDFCKLSNGSKLFSNWLAVNTFTLIVLAKRSYAGCLMKPCVTGTPLGPVSGRSIYSSECAAIFR